MLSHCQTCRFHSSHQNHCTDIGCAVNPTYWALWEQFRFLRPDPEAALLIDCCGDYQLNAPVPATSTAETLVGFWNYKVSFAIATYRIKIEFNETDKLIGHYTADCRFMRYTKIGSFPAHGTIAHSQVTIARNLCTIA